MSMNMGWCEVTLNNGTGTATWNHMDRLGDDYSSAAADAVELDGVPKILDEVILSTASGKIGFHALAATATGITVTSTHVDDESNVRIFAKVRELPQNWQA